MTVVITGLLSWTSTYSKQLQSWNKPTKSYIAARIVSSTQVSFPVNAYLSGFCGPIWIYFRGPLVWKYKFEKHYHAISCWVTGSELRSILSQKVHIQYKGVSVFKYAGTYWSSVTTHSVLFALLSEPSLRAYIDNWINLSCVCGLNIVVII